MSTWTKYQLDQRRLRQSRKAIPDVTCWLPLGCCWNPGELVLSEEVNYKLLFVLLEGNPILRMTPRDGCDLSSWVLSQLGGFEFGPNLIFFSFVTIAVFFSIVAIWVFEFCQNSCCWRPLKLGKNCRLFISVLKNMIFQKILVIQHYTCWILLYFDLHMVYCIMKNYPVTREKDEADWLDPLLGL